MPTVASLSAIIARLCSRVLTRLSAKLPFDEAMFLANHLLAAQGFGIGGFEVAKSGELAVIQSLKGRSPVLFDIGAHTGEYAQAFLDYYPEGSAYCFEPSAQHFRLLSERLANFTNVHLFKTAIGKAAGEGMLYTNSDVSGLASLTKRRLDHLDIRMDKSEPVCIDTLDNVLSRLSVARIDLLKIDVEGHELDVLHGATSAFKSRIIQRVQFEFGGCNLDTRTSLQDFFYFFGGRGFTLSLIMPSGHLQPLPFYREIYEQYRTTNYLASHSELMSDFGSDQV